MVVIHHKKTDIDQFLYECRTTDPNDTVIRDLVSKLAFGTNNNLPEHHALGICAIQNLREKVSRLAGAVEELAKHGPMKPEAEKGIDEILEKDGKKIDKGPQYNPDPIGHRNGNAPTPQLQDVLRRTAEEAKTFIGRDFVASGTALKPSMLQERIDLMRGAVTMAFPMGLPENDTIRLLIEDKDDLILQDIMGNDYMDPNTSTLWWAGKEFFRDGIVGDRVGKNEKTKVVARLQKKGGGPPAREPAVTEEERKAMMAWYFKKQEEQKALADDKEDQYLSTSWADPKALKRDLLGTSNIGFRPSGSSSSSSSSRL